MRRKRNQNMLTPYVTPHIMKIGGMKMSKWDKQGCQPITIPKHDPIKKIYVEIVRQIVESETEKDEDTE